MAKGLKIAKTLKGNSFIFFMKMTEGGRKEGYAMWPYFNLQMVISGGFLVTIVKLKNSTIVKSVLKKKK